MAGGHNPVVIAFRALGMALVASVLGFFVGTFLGIAGLGVYSAFTPGKPDFTIAYRVVGALSGLVTFLVALPVSVYFDVRPGRREG